MTGLPQGAPKPFSARPDVPLSGNSRLCPLMSLLLPTAGRAAQSTRMTYRGVVIRIGVTALSVIHVTPLRLSGVARLSLATGVARSDGVTVGEQKFSSPLIPDHTPDHGTPTKVTNM